MKKKINKNALINQALLYHKLKWKRKRKRIHHQFSNISKQILSV